MSDKESLLKPGIVYELVVAEDEQGMRLDQYLVAQFPAYSRSFMQKLIDAHAVSIDGVSGIKHSTPVRAHDRVRLSLPVFDRTSLFDKAAVDALGISVVLEHKDFFVINKPTGLLVHPAPGDKESITVVDWILTHVVDADTIGVEGRPGIVHRLDKDTSGLMFVARTPQGQAVLSDMFKDRLIKKTYLAMVVGHPDRRVTIDLPIGRDPITKHKMSHRNPQGKEAYTEFEVVEYFADTTLVKAYPTTGRTHQIRVHAAALGHPLVGDVLYGKASSRIKRHALHAQSLSFAYEGKEYTCSAPLAADFERLIAGSEPYEFDQEKT